MASAADPATDDYVIDRLRDLQLQHVRLTWSSDQDLTFDGFTARFLNRLLDEGFAVLLVLAPGRDLARQLHRSASAQQQWREFVRAMLSRYASRVETFELGNAPNRPSWSGYQPQAYLVAWRIVSEEAGKQGADRETRLAGPNVSDFEPYYSAALLRCMAQMNESAAIQTDNLFVERAQQPEADDPSALGRHLSRVVRLNLLKKARILDQIAARLSVPETYCTYTCWTRPRLARWSAEPDQKGADYLVRYLLLCAASDTLDRVYWGPLIDGRDGLIDCGHRDYPAVDNVAHYRQIRGALQDYQESSSYSAFRAMNALLANTTCVQAVSTRSGLHHFVFRPNSKTAPFDTVHVCYALDGQAIDINALYPEPLSDATVCDAQGQPIPCSVHRGFARERPLFMRWTREVPTPTAEQIQAAANTSSTGGMAGVVLDFDYSHFPSSVSDARWRGVGYLQLQEPAETVRKLLPEAIDQVPVQKVLRDKRNKLWSIVSPIDQQTLVVKLNRTTGMRRLSYLFRESKARRHWNNANEMIRRGVLTPAPVAFFEEHRFSALRPSVYVTKYLEDTFSTRDLFTAFARGEERYAELEKSRWLRVVAEFVASMHRKRVIHRDLSSGNILISMAGSTPKLYVIDIGRAVIDGPLRVLKDLNRICYKLNAADQATFIEHYQNAFPKQVTDGWRLSLWSYRAKQQLKGALKGKKRRSKPRASRS